MQMPGHETHSDNVKRAGTLDALTEQVDRAAAWAVRDQSRVAGFTVRCDFGVAFQAMQGWNFKHEFKRKVLVK